MTKNDKFILDESYSLPLKVELIHKSTGHTVDTISTPAEQIPGMIALLKKDFLGWKHSDFQEIKIPSYTEPVEITIEEWIKLVRKYESNKLPNILHIEKHFKQCASFN